MRRASSRKALPIILIAVMLFMIGLGIAVPLVTMHTGDNAARISVSTDTPVHLFVKDPNSAIAELGLCNDRCSYTFRPSVFVDGAYTLIVENKTYAVFNLSSGNENITLNLGAGEILNPITGQNANRNANPGVNVTSKKSSSKSSVKLITLRDGKGNEIKSGIRLIKPGQSRYGALSSKEELLDISINNSPVKRIVMRGFDEGRIENRTIYVDEVPKSVKLNAVQAYAIDPSEINFSTAQVTITARGSILYKCSEWNFSEQVCHGDWSRIMDIKPGMNYTINVTPDDPAFAEISILNVQSYPNVGGKWNVKFTTIGKANLTIRAVNGTRWSDENESEDLRFLSVKCGQANISYEWVNGSVFIQDYECNDTGYETSKVIGKGIHNLEFTFGNETAYAHNDARREFGYKVQQNVVNVNDLEVNETIDPVANTSHAFIILSRGTGPRPTFNANKNNDLVFVRGKLVSDDTITFDRVTNSETSYISYQVIEALDNEFTVYRGSGTFNAGAGQGNEWQEIDIGASVNVSNTIALVYNDLAGSSRNYGDQGLITAKMIDSTHLRLERVDGANVATNYEWQVIEFDPAKVASVNTGEILVSTNGETTPNRTAIGRTINLNSSLLIWQHRTDINGIVHASECGRFTNSSYVEFYMMDITSGVPSGDTFVRWYVIDFGNNSGYHESGHIDYSSDSTWTEANPVLYQAVSPNRTIAYVGHCTDGSNTGAAYPRPFHLWNMSYGNTLHIERGRYGQESYLDWQILELPFYFDTEAPVLTLESPPGPDYYNDTFNPVDITFNCSAYDKLTEVANISLYITDRFNTSFARYGNCTINASSGFCNKTLELYNGNYTWNCLAYDTEGNNNWSANRTILINFTDMESPTFDEVPVDQDIEFGTPFEYDINASDNYAFNSYYINDTSYTINSTTGLMENATYVAVGIYSINISVDDQAGNVNYTVIKINVSDTTPPNMTGVYNITELLGNNLSRELLATDLSEISNWTINNTQNFSMNSTGWLTNATPLPEGLYWVNVSVYDPYNNSVWREISVNITNEPDTMPPWFDPVPEDNHAEYGISYEYSVYGQDNIQVDSYTINDSSFTIDQYGVIRNSTDLTIGLFSVNVTINDTNGNENSTVFTINVSDTLSPTFTFIGHITNPYDTPVDVWFNATDFSAIKNWTVNDTVNFRIDPTGYFENNTNLSVLRYWVNVSVYDIFNNTNTKAIYVDSVDIYAPRFDELPADQTFEFGTHTIYDVNATDDWQFYNYSVNNSLFTIDADGILKNSTITPVGTYQLNITINDSSGNENSTVMAITVQDTIQPNITSIRNITVEFYTEIDEVFNATDISGIKNWTVNNSWFSINPSGRLTNNVQVPVGFLWLNITAIDNNDLKSSERIFVNITPYTGTLGWFVQHGEAQMLAGQNITYVDIKPVNPNHAFITVTTSAASSYDEVDQSAIWGYFYNSSRIALVQAANYTSDNAYAGWQVIENPSLRVQHYNYSFTSSDVFKDITLDKAVNATKTVVFIGYASANLDSSTSYNEFVWTGETIDSNTVRLKRDSSGSAPGVVGFSVVEFNDGSVIHTGEIANVGDLGTPSYIDLEEPVNVNESWVYFSHAASSAANGLDDFGIRVRNINGSRWEALREATGGTNRMRWYIITTPGAGVRRGVEGPGSLTTGFYPAGGFSSIQVNRSALFFSYYNSGGGTTYANYLTSGYLNNQITWFMRREQTGNQHSVAWQVIELPEYGIIWNQSSFDLGTTNITEGNLTGDALILSTGTNDQIVISCYSGDCGQIKENFTDGLTLDDRKNATVRFTCMDTLQGNHSALFEVSSSQDPSASTINVSCEILSTDAMVNSSSITFSNDYPAEGENITIFGNVFNIGTEKIENLTIQFYDISNDSQIGRDIKINLSVGMNKTVDVTWIARLGNTDIELRVDPPVESNGTIKEFNETNNNVTSRITVGIWATFYGKVSGNITFRDSLGKEVYLWNPEIKTGNILIADSDSDIKWSGLEAIGTNASGGQSSQDFIELDNNMQTGNYPDNITNTFTNGGTSPWNTTMFRVAGRDINDVPIINSTNSSTFVTGILWDASDDSDGKYDSEKEDVVFIANINYNKTGMFGRYDYEIRVPALLRNYTGSGNNLAVYVELT